MKKVEFAKWLKESKGQKNNTVSARISNVLRVDEEYNIDNQYAEDNCASLLEDFIYTKDDVKNGRVPAHNITIKGDYFTGTATLKYAIQLYIQFLNETNEGVEIKKAYNVKASAIGQADFTGNLDAFKRYIGPRCRNIVQYITSPYKKEKNIFKCEYCHKTGALDAAHREGKERIVIIKEILDKHFVYTGDTYKVNLNEFEKKFIEMQKPIEDHFFFLCKKCHTDYDNKKCITTKMILDEKQKGI